MGKNNRLFRVYAENFSTTLKKFGLRLRFDDKEITETLYVCPISMRCYKQSALENGDLTLEHVPPRSLGGTAIVLIERNINNNDGSTIDKKLLGFFEGENFRLNGGEIAACIKVGDDTNGIVSVKVAIDSFKGKPSLKFVTHKSNFAALEYKGLFKNWDGGKFQISGTLHRNIDRRALLKSAYLTAFSKIGYELIFGKNGFRSESYGRLISYLNGIDEAVDFPLVFLNDHAPLGEWSVGVITAPEHLGCFVVNLTFILKGKTFKYAVFLPNPDEDSCDNLTRLSEEMPLNKSGITFQVGYLPFDISKIPKKKGL